MRTRPRTRPRSLLLGGFAAAALLAACGGSDGGSSSDGTDAPSDVDVVFTGTSQLTWAEKDVTATAGDVTIELKNDSAVQHNLYLIAADGTENPKFLDSKGAGDNPVETVNLTAGTYTVICKVPGHTNMKATLTVS